MSVMEKWNNCHYTIQRLSILFGFILVFGLSMSGYIISFIVVTSCIALTSIEVRILKRIRDVENINRWSGALWILLTSSLAYICAEKLWVRIVLLCLVCLSRFIYLYSVCYSEKLTLLYIKNLILDIPVLLMGFSTDLFERQNIPEKKIKTQSRIMGICILLVVLMCIALPLYIKADERMYFIFAAFISGLVSGLPILTICAFLGILPAMANYSIIKGLAFDIVLDNPERQNMETVWQNNYFINSTVINVVLGGLTIVNVVFLALQIDQLIRCIIQSGTENLLVDKHRILPILICIGLNLIFLLLDYLADTDISKEKNMLLKYIFILSVLGNIVLVLAEYLIKIIVLGINASDLVGSGITTVYLIIVLVSVSCLTWHKGEFAQRVAVWGVVLLGLIHILPIEYFVSHINVAVFMDKYKRGIIEESVGQKDIDLEFLSSMGLDAVPAMTDLLDIEILYEGSEASLGEATEDYILKMFYRDLSLEEINTIENADGERLEALLEILDKKTEYKIAGNRSLAYDSLRDTIKADY